MKDLGHTQALVVDENSEDCLHKGA
jgi:hypothetical protein